MPRHFQNLEVGLDEDLDEKLQWLMPQYTSYRVLRKSVDARRLQPHWVYHVEVFAENETPGHDPIRLQRITPPASMTRPLIVGSGPAGLFAALRFVERGIPCALIERGSAGLKRIQAINRYWKSGDLDLENNVCFGEGGAGLYSDGKLITRIKSPHIPYVMDRMVQFGAPEEIKYLANPHVGSNRIRKVIPVLREFLSRNGCDIAFETKMTDLLVEGRRVVGVQTDRGPRRTDHVILATGHSAEDVLQVLRKHDVAIEGKSFALGLRIEHPQKRINEIQYREAAEHAALGAANYRLAHTVGGIGVYSFCMCPGGYVLSSGTDPLGVVSNGMSNYARNSAFANAALVVSVDHAARFGSSAAFAGLEFRRQLEREAQARVQASGGRQQLPAQRVLDFMAQTDGPALPSSCPSGVRAVRLDQMLPADIAQRLRQGVEHFDRQMRGFLSEQAQFHGIESRTSCPVRVVRDRQSLQSLSHAGLYPTGEGAGYAGGITSAACDGIRVAEAVMTEFQSAQIVTPTEKK